MDTVEPIPTLEFLHTREQPYCGRRSSARGARRDCRVRHEFVSCDSCFIYVLEGDTLVLRASKNPHPEWWTACACRSARASQDGSPKHREPVAIERDAAQDPRFRCFAELPEDSYHSFLSIPVISRGRVVSVINVQHREPYQFTPREIKSISTIGHLVGAAIELARLEGEIAELSDKLAMRKIIERAKGIVQAEFGVSEEEAYSIIKKQARSRRKTMKEIGEAILLAEELKREQKTNASPAA